MMSTSDNSRTNDVLELCDLSEDLRADVKRDNRKTQEIPAAAFLATLAAVPVWAFGIVPLTVAWQLGRFVITRQLPGKGVKPVPKLDSGYVVNDATPRPKRKYDVVVLGATGFTGKLCVRHLIRTYGVDGKKMAGQKQVKWAIAGRNQSKLDRVKKELVQELADTASPDDIDTILVDTTVPSMLPNLVRDTRCVVSTAGPFHVYANSVVEFCAKFGTHYVDISAEADWFKNMIVQWDETAQKTGAKLLTMCGCDSVPWDLTVHRMQKVLKEDGEDIVSVRCIDEIDGTVSGGTLYTISLILSGNCFVPPESDPFQKTVDGKVSSIGAVLDPASLLVVPTTFPWKKSGTDWTAPFLMAPVNAEAVGWSQQLRNARSSLRYFEASAAHDFKSAATMGLGLLFGMTAMLNPITSYLLRNFVFPKPGEGGDMKDMQEKSYLSVYATGLGSKGSKYESVMYFAADAGYLETARMVVEGGLSMALEEDALPVQRGGFFTPSVALGDVFLKRLIATGTTYKMKKVP